MKKLILSVAVSLACMFGICYAFDVNDDYHGTNLRFWLDCPTACQGNCSEAEINPGPVGLESLFRSIEELGMKNYHFEKLDNVKDAVDGLFAWDMGCKSSGIHDPLMKEALKKHFLKMSPDEQSLVAAKLASVYLSESGIEQGYRIEDVVALAKWLEDEMFSS